MFSTVLIQTGMERSLTRSTKLGKNHGRCKHEKKKRVAKALQVMDTDGDGFINFKEFMKVNNNMGERGGVKTNDIHNAFRVLDLDKNGKISTE